MAKLRSKNSLHQRHNTEVIPNIQSELSRAIDLANQERQDDINRDAQVRHQLLAEIMQKRQSPASMMLESMHGIMAQRTEVVHQNLVRRHLLE